MTGAIPAAILKQHVAVLGKTGSGKTSTAKVAVEQVVASGARVCVLDPIKSDWWGLISSASGKRPGLPFKILGGPRGHVPLHASSGKVIAELVASGKLPLSIIDMANFDPGGLTKFFNDFAPVLLRKMKGVLYLVIEEAHEFAPKERSGIGAESMAIHFAKKLATAGRSKGIRMIVCTQRTQALHNAVLGSCDTMIMHRLTAPADKKPVMDWLKDNVEKDVMEKVASSMSSLPTGTAWVCSGEAKINEQIKFPRIKTYDNSATPTDDDPNQDVKSAAVDQDELRTIIGDAVKEAEADDPKLLRAQIADLNKKLSAKPAAPAADPNALKRAQEEGIRIGVQQASEQYETMLLTASKELRDKAAEVVTLASKIGKNAGKLVAPKTVKVTPSSAPYTASPQVFPHGKPATASFRVASGDGAKLPKAERMILTALAQYPQGRTKTQVAVLCGYAVGGGGFNNALGSLRKASRVSGGDYLTITQDGIDAVGSYDPLPHGEALLQHWMRQLPKAERSILESAAGVYPRSLTKDELAQKAGYEPGGGGFNNALGKLRTLELISGKSDISASADLFG